MTAARWSALTALLGLTVSLYLTVVHYADGQVPLACVTVGVINCEEVTSSAESMIGQVPVALLGVVWFAAWLVLAFAPAIPRIVPLTWSAIGLAFVFYLVHAELFQIGALCLWCTVVHICAAVLFLFTVAAFTADPEPASGVPRVQPAPRGMVAPGTPGDRTRRDGA
jgi:uncharacterized membrane protein